MTTPYTPDEARGVALGIREEGIDRDMWDEIAVTLEKYADIREHLATVSSVLLTTYEECLTPIAKAFGFDGPELDESFNECMFAWAKELVDLRAELSRARAALGPDCPCGHYLKAEHDRRYRDKSGVYDDFGCVPCAEGMQPGVTRCEIGLVDLISNHPEIAKEMGLV